MRLRATKSFCIGAGKPPTVIVLPTVNVFAGAEVAFSLRTPYLSSYSGPLIRVRRSSDNTEQDISAASTIDAYGNKWLDESALATFVGANNGFIVKWYDQSGNGRDVTQSNTTIQPQIINAGVIYRLNTTYPSMMFGSSRRLARAIALTNFPKLILGSVFQHAVSVGSQNICTGLGSPGLFDNNNAGGFGFRIFNNAGGNGSLSVTRDTNSHVHSAYWDNTNVNLRIDGVSSSGSALSGNCTITSFTLGTNGGSGDSYNGAMSEFVVFTTLASSDIRRSLEVSEGNAFSITVS